MNTETEVIPLEEFPQRLKKAIKSLKCGNSIVVHYAGDNKVVCLSKGKTVFEVKDVDSFIAFQIQMILSSNNFDFTKHRCNPYTYGAVLHIPMTQSVSR